MNDSEPSNQIVDIPKLSSVIQPSDTRNALKPPHATVSPTSNPNKEFVWRSNGMEIDIFLQEPIHSNDFVAESSEPKHMDEEPKSIDIGDLDIFSLEQAFRKKVFDKI